MANVDNDFLRECPTAFSSNEQVFYTSTIYKPFNLHEDSRAREEHLAAGAPLLPALSTVQARQSCPVPFEDEPEDAEEGHYGHTQTLEEDPSPDGN